MFTVPFTEGESGRSLGQVSLIMGCVGMNALEVIKFSTATRVFSYMNTALTTIAEMKKIR